MKKQNLTLLTAALCFSVLVWDCGFFRTEGATEKQKIRSLTIMTWNLQTVFDGTEDGTEYADYRKNAGWSAEKYAGKLNVIAAAVDSIETVPDVIAVQEVESAVVINDLACALAKHGYAYSHFAKNPGMALGVGILSRFPLEQAKVHAISTNGDTAPRPVLETRLNISNGNLALFVCHWKSKLSGENLTEAGRRASARIILRRIRELAEQEPELPLIIMGDLNENHDEFYRRGGGIISALMPDDPLSAKQTGAVPQIDYLVISNNKPPVTRYFPTETTVLYSPWNNELKDGSYFYKNDWETIDHFLLSSQLFDKQGWEFLDCGLVNYPPFASPNGHPMAYNPRTGAGMSDHLPLMLTLQMADKL